MNLRSDLRQFALYLVMEVVVEHSFFIFFIFSCFQLRRIPQLLEQEKSYGDIFIATKKFAHV